MIVGGVGEFWSGCACLPRPVGRGVRWQLGEAARRTGGRRRGGPAFARALRRFSLARRGCGAAAPSFWLLGEAAAAIGLRRLVC